MDPKRQTRRGHGGARGGVQHLGMGAGCRHSTRDGWTPQPAPMPQFPSVLCHTQGTFGAPQGGSTSWCPLMGPIPPSPVTPCEDGGKEGLQPSSHPHQQPPGAVPTLRWGCQAPLGPRGGGAAPSPPPSPPAHPEGAVEFLVGGTEGQSPPVCGCTEEPISAHPHTRPRAAAPARLGGSGAPLSPRPARLGLGVGNKVPPNATFTRGTGTGGGSPFPPSTPRLSRGGGPVSPPGCSECPSPPIRGELHWAGLLPAGGSFVAHPARQRGGP